MKTKEKTFNVREQSLIEFFEKFQPGCEGLAEGIRQRCDPSEKTSPYHLMQDTIILRNSCGIKEGTKVMFHLVDDSSRSGTKLAHEYEYEASKYDDCTIELKLVTFKVKHCNYIRK